ncbi:MAG: hypothetical protein ABR956_14085 [Terracidiphilus sp.]|jgi:tRNA threonylcarbamoyladenosine modification (KEOPS) complex Cgi121 subunit
MADTKTVECTLRIAGKRQVTLPERFLNAVNLKQGDHFMAIAYSPSDIRLIPCTSIRRDLITPEVDEILKRRRAEIEAGAAMISQDELLKRAAVKNARRRARSLAKVAAKAALRPMERIAAG